MRLWSDEIEAMRAEAREVVDAGLDEFRRTNTAQDSPSQDAVEQLAAERAALSNMYNAVPEGEDRSIAEVPCRVFVPDGTASVFYLHFHGRGIINGFPLMNDADNLKRSRDQCLAVVSVHYRLAPEHPYPAGGHAPGSLGT